MIDSPMYPNQIYSVSPMKKRMTPDNKDMMTMYKSPYLDQSNLTNPTPNTARAPSNAVPDSM